MNLRLSVTEIALAWVRAGAVRSDRWLASLATGSSSSRNETYMGPVCGNFRIVILLLGSPFVGMCGRVFWKMGSSKHYSRVETSSKSHYCIRTRRVSFSLVSSLWCFLTCFGKSSKRRPLLVLAAANICYSRWMTGVYLCS